MDIFRCINLCTDGTLLRPKNAARTKAARTRIKALGIPGDLPVHHRALQHLVGRVHVQVVGVAQDVLPASVVEGDDVDLADCVALQGVAQGKCGVGVVQEGALQKVGLHHILATFCQLKGLSGTLWTFLSIVID